MKKLNEIVNELITILKEKNEIEANKRFEELCDDKNLPLWARIAIVQEYKKQKQQLRGLEKSAA